MIQDLDTFLEAQFATIKEQLTKQEEESTSLPLFDSTLTNCLFMSKKSEESESFLSRPNQKKHKGKQHRLNSRIKSESNSLVIIFSDSQLNYKKLQKNVIEEQSFKIAKFIPNIEDGSKFKLKKIKKINPAMNVFLIPDNILSQYMEKTIDSGFPCSHSAYAIADCQSIGK